MLKTTQITKLVASYGASQLEKHLIKSYIDKRGLNITESGFLLSYFNSFEEVTELTQALNKWPPENIKELENYLELSIPEADKRLNGAFFTPVYIVDFIIGAIQPQFADKNLDPSCGSGAFLIGLAQYYKSFHNKSIKQTVKDNIYGADIADYNTQRAKVLLALFALEEGEVLAEADFNIYHVDSLRFEWKSTFDVIIGNPPYVKFQDLTDSNREFLAKEWRTIKGGAFNLYFPFFELGYNLLNKNGRLAFITPNNYFTSLAGEPLRQFMMDTRSVYRVIDFSHKKIFSVLTYTAITFLNRENNQDIAYDRIEDTQNPTAFLEQLNFSSVPYASLLAKKWRLLKDAEVGIIRRIENAGESLGRLFEISVGIATLKDEVFFVDTRHCVDGYYTKTTAAGTFTIEAAVTRPLFKISDFGTQEEVDANSRRVIYPYQEQQGVITAIAEQDFMHTYPGCYAYLLSERKQLLARDKGKVAFSPFYVWGRTQGMTRKGLKVVTPTFSQVPRFLQIQDPTAFFTNGYALFYRNQHAGLFADAANQICLPENVDVLQQLLNSRIMAYYMAKTSVSIDGGYPCYQKNFIEKFSVPHFSRQDIEHIRSNQDGGQAVFLQKYQLNLLLG